MAALIPQPPYRVPAMGSIRGDSKLWWGRLTMQTKVSTKGPVVLPSPLRRRLDIRPGDPLDVNMQAEALS